MNAYTIELSDGTTYYAAGETPEHALEAVRADVEAGGNDTADVDVAKASLWYDSDLDTLVTDEDGGTSITVREYLRQPFGEGAQCRVMWCSEW